MSSRDTCVTLLQPASFSQIWCLQLAVVQNPILEYFIYILFLNIVIIAIIIISIVIIVFSNTIIFFQASKRDIHTNIKKQNQIILKSLGYMGINNTTNARNFCTGN